MPSSGVRELFQLHKQIVVDASTFCQPRASSYQRFTVIRISLRDLHETLEARGVWCPTSVHETAEAVGGLQGPAHKRSRRGPYHRAWPRFSSSTSPWKWNRSTALTVREGSTGCTGTSTFPGCRSSRGCWGSSAGTAVIPCLPRAWSSPLPAGSWPPLKSSPTTTPFPWSGSINGSTSLTVPERTRREGGVRMKWQPFDYAQGGLLEPGSAGASGPTAGPASRTSDRRADDLPVAMIPPARHDSTPSQNPSLPGHRIRPASCAVLYTDL